MNRLAKLWTWPVRDIAGFSRSYLVVASGVSVVLAIGALACDQTGRFSLASLVAKDSTPALCNISIAARAVFAFLVLMEGAGLTAVIALAAFKRDSGDRVGWPNLFTLKRSALLALFTVFLHLPAYGMAFQAEDACTAPPIVLVKHYALLVGSALLYAFGSILLIGLAMLVLERSLLRAKSTT